MAKRRRLTLHGSGPAARPGSAASGPEVGPEVGAWLRPGLGGGSPPIAQVAADAAATAALAEVSGAMAAARAEGRLVQRLPLAAVEAGHLARDRLGVDEGELAALIASIRSHGQRMPVEVTEIAAGRYGLISGWRRLAALKRLAAETGEARFAEVLALVRRPAGAAAAYVAMVEENELRLALSHYERARIVASCVDLGVFPTGKAALNTLFAAGSRARRSKIGSFVPVVRALEGAVRHPGAIHERLGLKLAAALDGGAVTAAGLRAALAALPPEAGPGAEAAALAAALATALAAAAKGGGVSRAKHPPASAPPAAAPPPGGAEMRPGLFVDVSGGFLQATVTLSGPGVTPEFRERLEIWLRTGR
jgi:ParB/RepB/Spo0J family partition protein